MNARKKISFSKLTPLILFMRTLWSIQWYSLFKILRLTRYWEVPKHFATRVGFEWRFPFSNYKSSRQRWKWPSVDSLHSNVSNCKKYSKEAVRWFGKEFFLEVLESDQRHVLFSRYCFPLHPSLRILKDLETFIAPNDERIREIVCYYIKDMACKYLEEDKDNGGIMDLNDHHSPYLQRGRSARNHPKRDIFSLSSFSDFADITASPGCVRVSSDTQGF